MQMSHFLETFVLPLLVALVAYAVADQRNWTAKSRFWTVTIALVLAGVSVFVAHRLQSTTSENVTPANSPTPIMSPLPAPAAPPTAEPKRYFDSGPPKPRSNTAEDEFITKYLAHSDGSAYANGWTVLFSSPSLKDFSELYAAAEGALSDKGYSSRPLFRSTLLHDAAAYDELYDANPALLKRLSAYREGFLVGKVRSEVSHNASLDIFTAHLFVQLRVISAPQGQILSRVTTDETGAGFSEAAALSAAEQRIADKMREQLIRSIPAK
jgi:hypothetical protein